jgi:hypothetical protein
MANEITVPKIPQPSTEINLSQPIKEAEENACQWFLGEKAFCDKIKKNVRCDGNVRNCPF